MTEHLDIGIEGRLGIITLDRPEAINALSLDMIEGITRALQGWRDDDKIRAVLFEGRGPRGFCAGGDVRAVRSLVLAGRIAEAEAYFDAEYSLNGLIATYPKPVAALTHGAVMGGGIGIAGHAQFRFALPDVKFAMPESAIGFVVDTGVNAILAMAPLERALLFVLSGLPVGAADALALGLVDCVVAPGRAEALRTGIILAAGAGDVPTSLVSLMQAESVEAGEALFCLGADRLAQAFGLSTAAEIVEAIVADDAGRDFAQILQSRSPSSLETILQSHRAARRSASLDEILAIDGRLARLAIARPDFPEGVRAVLVDKDMAPKWNPARLDETHVEAIKKVIENHEVFHDYS
jgi:enoyl-CoA hydratase